MTKKALFYAVFLGPMLAGLLLISLSSASAATVADVDFKDQVSVGGKPLALNGLGMRTATAFKVKVYAIGLYLENKSDDPEAIMASDGNKRVTMHFLHKVSADELAGDDPLASGYVPE